MGAEADVDVTEGTGTPISTFQMTAGKHDQIVRHRAALTESEDFWTPSTTASLSQIPADANRVGMLMVSAATGRVWLRFDATAPTETQFHWFIDPGERWPVPPHLVPLAVSMLGQYDGGSFNTHMSSAG